MAGNRLNRYLWLINLLQTEGPIPYKEISKRWERSIYNDKQDVGLPLKTFHNHCLSIAEIFGVDVECEKKSPYGYYIPQPAESEVWKFDMLNRLLLHSAIKDDPTLADRVKNLDQKNDKEIPRIVECIQKQGVISFIKSGRVTSKSGTLASAMKERINNGKRYSDFLVLASIEVGYQWFVIGAFIEQDKPFEGWRVSVFALDNMEEIKTMYEMKNVSAKAFSLQEYIDSFAFDPSDTFDDDRYLLEQCLRNYRLTHRYGRLCHVKTERE